MYSNLTVSGVYSVLGAAVIACTLFAGNVLADGRPVTVALKVSTRGLDLETSAGAHELYSRLKNAAWSVCNNTLRVGLEPTPDPYGCSEKALAEAILSANMTRLTQIYLETHTLREAAERGIRAPVQLAAK
ncbi:MAG: UrcA family protein [Steroidobacteraceae bacterium]|jgi:UrcA family protein